MLSLIEIFNFFVSDHLKKNKMCTDKTKTKLTKTTLITPTSIHTNKTNHQSKV